jgi:hypothetical protein
MKTTFQYQKRDSQSTMVAPVSAENFDFEAYQEYEASLFDRQKAFLQKDSGILVYRRVRADGVFYDKCRNKKESLELQLGALQKSMEFQADIANFLEPWYGIGYIAGCFGGSYEFPENQAPVVKPMFHSMEELLNAAANPIEKTEMGRHILEMTEYFMDKTKGRVPVSLTDVQSPINMLSYLLPITDLFMEVYDDPEGVKEGAMLLAGLLRDFLKKQQTIIGDALALPGHGFASSRVLKGIGLSDDNSIMISEEDYEELFQPADELLGEAFGGLVFHSCGTWENKISMVKNLGGILMADGAFTAETDPSPNSPEPFREGFSGSGLILNARAVGADAKETFRRLYGKGMKLIAVTYCESAAEQKALYQYLHELETER